MTAGPFYIAWVTAAETVFGPEHEREDEKVFKLDVKHDEGAAALMSIDILNPRIGLLATGRKQWMLVGYDDGGTDGPRLIFRGRLVGIGTNIAAEVITLRFVARPDDFLEQQQALTETLKDGEGYDPIFLDETKISDPNAMLEAYTVRWHVDRTTLDVSLSDILIGEDGIEDFTADEVPYDSVDIPVDKAPNPSVTVEVDVSWTQKASGQINLGSHIFQSYAGDGYLGDFPKPLATLQAGWSVANSTALDVLGVATALTASWSYNYTNKEKEHANGDTMSVSFSSSAPAISAAVSGVLTSEVQVGLIDPFADPQVNIPAHMAQTTAYVPLWQINTTLTLQYDAERQRSEKLRFTLTADLQPMITDAIDVGNDSPLTLTGRDLGLLLDDSTDSAPPIGDASRSEYFTTDRGQESIVYALLFARRNLLERARAIPVSFECPFVRATYLSCRKNGRLFDYRISGGEALGKITTYSFSVDGDSGSQIGNVTLGCSIGYGNAIEEVAGEPDYVDEDVIDDSIQTFTGSVVALPGSDLGYTPPGSAVIDDGLVFPLTKSQVLVRDQIMGASLATQAAAISSALGSMASAAVAGAGQPTSAADSLREQITVNNLNKNTISTALQANPRWREIELKPVVNGPFNAEYELTVTNLTVPQGINLEAAA